MRGIATNLALALALFCSAAIGQQQINLSTQVRGVLPSANGGAGTVNGIMKANGSGTTSAATSGSDYAPATSGSSILKGNGAGGFSNAASGSDYAPATSGSVILLGNGAGGFSNYAGSSPSACSNQFLRNVVISTAGVHTNTCASVSLSLDITGTLGLSNGGTGSAPGADDQVLVSDSTSAATWRSLSSGAVKYTTGTNTFAQAACADLSNGAASCSTDTTNASNIASGTLGAARLPGTVADDSVLVGDSASAATWRALSSGAVKYTTGTNTFAQAACADLSNGATGCSTATGTSGATIPLLNGSNTWSGAQSINSGGLILKGATSGTITLNAAATAGSNTVTLPAGTTDFSATGGTSQVVKQTSSGGALTVARLACADLSDSASGCSSASGAGPTTRITVVTGTGTVTIPTSATMAKVTMVGGGGGGGGVDTTTQGQSSGGGAAPTAVKWLTGLTAALNLSATIGTGGAGGSTAGGNGVAGVQTSLASGTQTITTISANGGALGVGNAAGTASVAGAAVVSTTSGADYTIPGQGSSRTVANIAGSTEAMGSNGGSSSIGQGGVWTRDATGSVGNNYGSGGGGVVSTSTGRAGGAGAPGVIIIEWF